MRTIPLSQMSRRQVYLDYAMVRNSLILMNFAKGLCRKTQPFSPCIDQDNRLLTVIVGTSIVTGVLGNIAPGVRLYKSDRQGEHVLVVADVGAYSPIINIWIVQPYFFTRLTSTFPLFR